ncbi:MAG: FG-GAP repeat protein, partial [Chloroflexi bacterium]|nr:FG-GAP repeat protein [Chloroflexota bacterium]
LVGTYYSEFSSTHPLGPGSVYAFIKDGDTWVFQQKLPTPPMPDADLFGYSVALSADGNTALVGAQGDTGPAETQVPGAAFVFIRSEGVWSQQAVLTAADRAVGDHFGISVALSDSGNTALVGAYVDDVDANANQGSAYVYERDGAVWSEQAHLTASDGAAEDYFGRSVSLSSDGSTALIGANMKMIGGNVKQGAAYIFTRTNTTWSQQAQLTAVDGAAYDWLGVAVAISADGNTALAGAQGHMIGSNFLQGAAFVFVRSESTWSQQAMLAAPEDEVSLWGDAAALSPDGSTALIEDGYTFARTGTSWAPGARLLPSDDTSGFGAAVALSGDGSTALIGANGADIGGNQSQGEAYFFTKSADQFAAIYLPMVIK